MDKELRKLLKEIEEKPRPRPLMFVGWHNGRKCYVRKRSLSYFQLLEKYPPPFDLKRFGRPRHVFRMYHFLKSKPIDDYAYGCIILCGVISFVIFVVSVYAYRLLSIIL